MAKAKVLKKRNKEEQMGSRNEGEKEKGDT